MQTAFIAGATGYTGRAVVAECVAAGATVWAHVRPDSPTLAQWRGRLAALGARIDCTPWESGAMAARLLALQPDVVFSLLGTTRARARQERLSRPYRAVDFGLTALLADAAAGCAVPPRFVYLSAMGVSQRLGLSAYLNARVLAERHLRAGPLPWTIARPGMIGGADRTPARPAERVGEAVLVTVARGLKTVGLAKLAQQVRPVTGQVLARALVALAVDPAAAGHVADAAELHARGERGLERRAARI